MADFCLGQDVIIGITRQIHLMDRMCGWAGIPVHAVGKIDPGLWFDGGCDASAAP
jgi:hypothetical protein